MKISQKNLIQIIILAFVALYNFLLFMIVGDTGKTEVFWISYGFIMFAPALLFILTVFPLSYTGGTRLVLSLPTYRTILVYCVVEFVVGTVFMLIQKQATVKASLLVQIPLFIVFAIIFFVYLLGAAHISENYEKQKCDVFALNQMYTSVHLASKSTPSPTLSNRLERLAEKIKNSDFNSYPETKDVEREIRNTIGMLQGMLDNESDALNLINKLDMLVEQRRETCKYIKKMRG